MNIWARITSRSGRSFSFLDFGSRPNLMFERKDHTHIDDVFVIKTFPGDRRKPRKGTRGLCLEFDKKTMDQIVAAYKRLF